MQSLQLTLSLYFSSQVTCLFKTHFYEGITCISAGSGNVLNSGHVTDLNRCPQPQLFQSPSRLLNYSWMHGGMLASQFTEWLPATILRHASAYMYKCVHRLGASKTLTPLLDESPAAVSEGTCWCDLRTTTAD